MSPERINQQRLPQSPVLQGFLVENEWPRSRDSFVSDVRSKIARLDSLAVGASAQSSPTKAGRSRGAQQLDSMTMNGAIEAWNNVNSCAC